jgi:hypothetical protein
MTFCINCGVELDDGTEICPLCGQDPLTGSKKADTLFHYPSDIIQLHRKEIRMSLWELSAIIAFSSIAVCTIVDLIITKGLYWSLFADMAIITAWITLTLFLHAYKRTWVIFAGLLLTALSALFVFDYLVHGIKWFFTLGAPLTLAFFISAMIVYILSKAANLKGLNIIAAAIVILAGFCILSEMIIDNHMYGSVHLRWSVIAAISAFPVSILLFYYHYRLKKGKRLNSFFHI